MKEISKIKNIIDFTKYLASKGIYQCRDDYNYEIFKSYFDINEVEKVDYLLKERISEIYKEKNYDSENAKNLLNLLDYTGARKKAKELFLDFISLEIINASFHDYLSYGYTELAYEKLNWDKGDENLDGREKYYNTIHRYERFVISKKNPLVAFNVFKKNPSKFGRDIIDKISLLTQICSGRNNFYNKDDFAFNVISYHKTLLSQKEIQRIGVYKAVESLCKVAKFYLIIKNHVKKGNYTSLDASRDANDLLIKAKNICDEMAKHPAQKYKYYSLLSYYHYLNDDESSARGLISEVLEHDIHILEKNKKINIGENYFKIFEDIKIAKRVGSNMPTESLVIEILELTIKHEFRYSHEIRSYSNKFKEKSEIRWGYYDRSKFSPIRHHGAVFSSYNLVEEIYDYLANNNLLLLVERLINYLELLNVNNPITYFKNNNPRITLLLAKCYIFTKRIEDGIKAMNSIVNLPREFVMRVLPLRNEILAKRLVDLQIELGLSDKEFFKNPKFGFVFDYKFKYYLKNKNYFDALRLIEIAPQLLNKYLMELTRAMCYDNFKYSSEFIGKMKNICRNYKGHNSKSSISTVSSGA